MATFREAALAYLADHPRSSATEVSRALTGSGRSGKTALMQAMMYAGEVVRDYEPRPAQVRPVQVWSVAPPGTVPPPRPPSPALPAGQRSRATATRAAARARDTRAAIAAALDTTPGLTAAEIAPAAGLKHRPVRQLREMTAANLITARPGTGGPRYYPAPAPARPVRELACASEDPEIFFPLYLSAAAVGKAAAVCARCPGRAACLAGAVERAEPWGIWGGQVFENGRVITGRQLAAAS